MQLDGGGVGIIVWPKENGTYGWARGVHSLYYVSAHCARRASNTLVIPTISERVNLSTPKIRASPLNECLVRQANDVTHASHIVASNARSLTLWVRARSAMSVSVPASHIGTQRIRSCSRNHFFLLPSMHHARIGSTALCQRGLAYSIGELKILCEESNSNAGDAHTHSIFAAFRAHMGTSFKRVVWRRCRCWNCRFLVNNIISFYTNFSYILILNTCNSYN